MGCVYIILTMLIIINAVCLLLEYSNRIGTIGIIRAYYDEQIGKGWIATICGVILLIVIFYIDNK